MDHYVTSALIRRLREEKKLSQSELAERIGVTDKAVSKWETAKGLPDISLLEPLAGALGVSVPELLNGEQMINRNRSANLLRAHFAVCPVCGNILYCTGEAMLSCCGITLPMLEAEAPDEAHAICVEHMDGEYFVHVPHEMEKDHFISFLAYVTGDCIQLCKCYPEGNAETRFRICGTGCFYAYCNRHGLFRISTKAALR